jgi:hypothetical protein
MGPAPRECVFTCALGRRKEISPERGNEPRCDMPRVHGNFCAPRCPSYSGGIIAMAYGLD